MSNPKRTKRLSLLAASALLVVGLGATFAATADSTSTGDLDVTSGQIAEGIDVRIADKAITDNGNCEDDTVDGDYAQDQTIDLLTYADAAVDDGAQDVHFCLKNFGTENADLDAITIQNVVSTELGCSFDEQNDDADCDSSATGDLDPFIYNELEVGTPAANECWIEGDPGVSPAAFGQTTGNPIANGTSVDVSSSNLTIFPDTTLCITARVDYDNGTNTTPTDRNAAQTDQFAWQLRVDTVQGS